MGVDLYSQGLMLLSAMAAGGLLGLGYDLLRPLRHRFGEIAALGLDALFCLGALWAMFALAMSSDRGKLGTWDIIGAGLGFLLYLYCLSPAFLKIYVPCIESLCVKTKALKKIIKKSAVSAKFFFKKVRECFIIKQ